MTPLLCSPRQLTPQANGGNYKYSPSSVENFINGTVQIYNLWVEPSWQFRISVGVLHKSQYCRYFAIVFFIYFFFPVTRILQQPPQNRYIYSPYTIIYKSKISQWKRKKSKKKPNLTEGSPAQTYCNEFLWKWRFIQWDSLCGESHLVWLLYSSYLLRRDLKKEDLVHCKCLFGEWVWF